MRNGKLYLLVLILGTATLFSSCVKNDGSGDFVPVRGKKPPVNELPTSMDVEEMIIGQWTLDFIDGETLSDYEVYLEFKNNNQFEEIFYIDGSQYYEEGEWFLEEPDQLRINFDYGSVAYYTISEITNYYLKLIYNVDNTVLELSK